MTEDHVLALFMLADIPVERIWKLPNGYMGELEPLTDHEIVRDTSKDGAGYVERRSNKEDPHQTVNVVRAWMDDHRWRHERPAYLIKTPFGLLQITERKRVIDLNWSETRIRCVVTTDDTTKSDTNVHAWDREALSRYLITWKEKADVQIQTGATA